MSLDWRRLLADELGDEALHDEGVEAARNACVAGAPVAAGVITAAAFYDNPLTGVPALRACLAQLAALPADASVGAWQAAFRMGVHPETGDEGFSPGFGFVDAAAADAVRAALVRVAGAFGGEGRCRMFLLHHDDICGVAGPLNPAGLTALVCADHGADADEAERLYMLARIDAAVREAQAARRRGVAAFPFLSEVFVYEGARPPGPAVRDLAALFAAVDLDDGDRHDDDDDDGCAADGYGADGDGYGFDDDDDDDGGYGQVPPS